MSLSTGAENREKILIRGVNWLGDAVMSTPALLRLRDARPQAHITLLTAAKLADLWTSHPAIDAVIPFTKAEGIGNVSKKLRAGNFDTALILPNSFRSACESWMAGIPKRIGFGGNGRGMLLTQVVAHRAANIEMRKRSTTEVSQLVKDSPDKPRDRYPVSGHHLHNYLHLVSALGANPAPAPPKIAVTDLEKDEFRNRIALDKSRPTIALNPGAEYGPAKRWPVERFIESALLIQQRTPCNWLITGGPGDVSLAAGIASAIRVKLNAGENIQILNLAGKTSLRELCILLSVCDAVVTNDTGPMHLAAAVGAAVVVPFGSTSPELTGPGLPEEEKHRLVLGQAPCAPCFRRECPIDFRCMLSITPEKIASEVLPLIRSYINSP